LDEASPLRPEQRRAFLDRACKDDAALRAEIESLLEAHDRAPSGFLESAIDIDSLDDRIPGHEIVRRLGGGGMGEVWLARETHDLRRVVAIKLIKLGMDTREILRRFKVEQRALGLMDHECIANVYTAGMTERGRPYFSMEFVDGEPIDVYCDRHRLSIRDRLELFVRVCEAVHHSHTRGVVHRDLKPSNILVAQVGPAPLPKVIDFGIAKATVQSAGGTTLRTGTGFVLGTPEYMSPEQFDSSSSEIDARSDVYSLGVILYELLAGCRPVEYQTELQVGPEELRRRAREQSPRSLSASLEKSGRGEAISSSRGTDIAALVRLLKGPLNRIVLHALERERGSRYPTAAALAADVQRYLSGEDVIPTVRTAAWLWKPAVLLLVVFGLGLGAWWLGILPRTRGFSIRRLRVAIVTDGYVVPHISDIVLAFRNTGASVSVAQDELISGKAMSASIVTGYDLVVVITAVGTVDMGPIDAVDVDVLKASIRSRSSPAFLLMTDACSLCSMESARMVLSAFNEITGWDAKMGAIVKTRFQGRLEGSGAYAHYFASWPAILGNNYSPLLTAPPDDVIYRTDAGILTAVAPARQDAACVFLTTDATPFVSAINGTPPGQADGLAAAYLEAATSPNGPCARP
jgi:serine/threonine protein kinase